MDRREFVKQGAAAGAGLLTLGLGSPSRADSPSERVRLAFMGVNGRGRDLANAFSAIPQAEIAYICDVDDRAIAKCMASLEKKVQKAPQTAKDVRKVLEDPNVDALVVAAPNHWHGPAAILACDAGKHVYVEKPACHNPREGELMVAAARKHNKVVQLGTQRRSMPGVGEAVAKLREGIIGPVRFSRGWYNNSRGSIGQGKPAPVPGELDYALWGGPAPERPYVDNLVHYNWHWRWHWGNGELGNNGIHSLDICRWGLGVDYPSRVTSGGGRYFFQDDWETPDTQVVTYEFDGKAITWEGRSCHRRGFEDSMFGIAFYGDGGTLIIDGGGYRVLDPQNKEVTKVAGSSSDRPHLENFLQCVKSGKSANAEIEEGHKSTLLCHLGNIAQRTGRTLTIDPKTGRILGDKDAMKLWSREYRKGWEPRV